MKKSLFQLFAALILTMCFCPFNGNAAVNVESYLNGSAIPGPQAKELLTNIFMHNPNQLDKLSVEVANLRKRSDINIAFIYVGRLQNNFNTEIYAITLDTKWNTIDGAMIGYDSDARLLAIPVDNKELIYKPSNDLEYTLRGDSIIVTRKYEFASTAKGGDYFHKDGTIVNRFLIRKDGKLAQIQFDATANLTEGNANYLSDDHKPAKHSKTAGEFFGLGMSILNLEQTPAQTKLNPETINNLAGSMKNVAKINGRKTGNVENECVAEFAQCVTNLALRDGNDILSWVARNEGKENISQFVLTSLKQSGLDEVEWMTAKLKKLKDKKARKWWQKWLKKELGVDAK